ncbi:MAG: hypothetical protein ACPGQQ_00795 [Candidatus Puniceispirillaceae bacterium]
MPDQVRCKFECKSVLKLETQEQVKMSAVCGNWDDKTGIGEDNTYAKYSPSGEFELTVANEACFGFFEPGKKYYLDITPAPEEKAAE